MISADHILESILRLPKNAQREVLNFAEFLHVRLARAEEDEDRLWSEASMAQAMKDMEDEEALYSENDIREKY